MLLFLCGLGYFKLPGIIQSPASVVCRQQFALNFNSLNNAGPTLTKIHTNFS